jgi:hypothetical protein
MTHTATPWRISGYSDVNGNYLHIGAETSPMVLASMNERHVDTKANAEFIVRACNAHDDLVRVLKKIRRNDLPANEQPLWDEICAALAKAGAA